MIAALRCYVHGLIQHRLLVAVVLASAVGVVVTSKDFFFTPLAAGTLAGVMAVAIRRVWQAPKLASLRQARAGQMLSVAAIPVLFAAGLAVNEAHLFKQAVGIAPGANARDLTVDANLVTPGGARVVLMRFAADPGCRARLLEQGSFAVDKQMEYVWGTDESWPAAMRLAFGDAPRLGGDAWADIKPMTDPQYRRWVRTVDGTRHETCLLWDAALGPDASGDSCYMLYRVN